MTQILTKTLPHRPSLELIEDTAIYDLVRREADVLGVWILSPGNTKKHVKAVSIDAMQQSIVDLLRPGLTKLNLYQERVSWYLCRFGDTIAMVCAENRPGIDWEHEAQSLAKNAKITPKIQLTPTLIKRLKIIAKEAVGPAGDLLIDEALHAFGASSEYIIRQPEIASLIAYIRDVPESTKENLKNLLEGECK